MEKKRRGSVSCYGVKEGPMIVATCMAKIEKLTDISNDALNKESHKVWETMRKFTCNFHYFRESGGRKSKGMGQ